MVTELMLKSPPSSNTLVRKIAFSTPGAFSPGTVLMLIVALPSPSSRPENTSSLAAENSLEGSSNEKLGKLLNCVVAGWALIIDGGLEVARRGSVQPAGR